MSSVTVRSETRTIRSMPGMSRTSPGPRWSTSRPSRNTTARSYSRRTRTDAAASATEQPDEHYEGDQHGGHGATSHSSARRTVSVSPSTRSTTIGSPRCRLCLVVAGPQPRPPERAVEEDLAERRGRRAHLADAADQPLAPAAHPAARGGAALAHDDRDVARRDERGDEAGGQRGGEPEARSRDDEGEARRRCRGGAAAERAVRRHVRLGRRERGAQEHQHDAERGQVRSFLTVSEPLPAGRRK